MIFATKWKQFVDSVHLQASASGVFFFICQLVIEFAFEAFITMNETLFLNKKMASTWANMIERCYNPKASSYYWYGERGIKMCERWQSSVANFIADMGLPPTLTHSIDRIDCNGDYEPSNCRWATAAEQNNNTRRSKLITWNGKTQSVRDWAKEYDIGARGLSERLRRGWDMEKSLTAPGRLSFDLELADRRERNNELWKSKGKLYSARSKQKRGHRLSTAEQQAVQEDQINVDLLSKEACQAQSEYELRNFQKRRMMIQEFADWA